MTKFVNGNSMPNEQFCKYMTHLADHEKLKKLFRDALDILSQFQSNKYKTSLQFPY